MKAPLHNHDNHTPAGGTRPHIPGLIMRFNAVPRVPEAGEMVTLTFDPQSEEPGSARVELAEVHEQKLHVMIVSRDLSWYDHIHPVNRPDGSFAAGVVFPFAGSYLLFADYKPMGSDGRVERFMLEISGAPVKQLSFINESLVSEAGAFQVRLSPARHPLRVHQDSVFTMDVSEKDVAVTTFEDIMGAKGHLVIISGDGQQFVHVHPAEEGDVLSFHTHFMEPGIYRAFFQFKVNSQMHTAYFTLDVQGAAVHA